MPHIILNSFNTSVVKPHQPKAQYMNGCKVRWNIHWSHYCRVCWFNNSKN